MIVDCRIGYRRQKWVFFRSCLLVGRFTIVLFKEVKTLVDDKAKYTDWNKRDDIKAELEFDLMVLLDEWGYPPVDSNEVYKEIFEQAENFKKNRVV